jgi:hypothetical protein
MMKMVIFSKVIKWLINQIWLYIYYLQIINKILNSSIFRNTENQYAISQTIIGSGPKEIHILISHIF